eukprot:1512399-Alexandrium_andersonii.AAC.1
MLRALQWIHSRGDAEILALGDWNSTVEDWPLSASVAGGFVHPCDQGFPDVGPTHGRRIIDFGLARG